MYYLISIEALCVDVFLMNASQGDQGAVAFPLGHKTTAKEYIGICPL